MSLSPEHRALSDSTTFADDPVRPMSVGAQTLASALPAAAAPAAAPQSANPTSPDAGLDPVLLAGLPFEEQLHRFTNWVTGGDRRSGGVDRSAFPATLGAGKPGGTTGRGGAETRDVLPIGSLEPVQGEITGPQMLIVDNPETFRSPGVLGSTMAPVRDRGDTTHDFVGVARYFALSQNATGRALRNMILIKNTSNKDLDFRVQGEVYCNKGVTKTDGRIQQNYKANGEFQGPHAIASSAYLDAQKDKNGYVSKTVKVKAGDTEVVNDQYHETGSEVFALVEITASDPRGTFRVAGVAHATSLNEEQENAVGRGDWAAAGDPTKEDFAGADKNKLGRPNGVITAGSIFNGGRTFEVKAGSRDGDLVMSTRFKNAGESEAAPIAKPLPNKDPKRNGVAANLDDGNYGIEYLLSYELKNTSNAPVTAQLLFTAPRIRPNENHAPMGGEIVMPMEVDGRRVEVRVNARGDGVEVGKWTIGPGASKRVPIRFVNFGNIFPPAGFEVRGS